MKGCSVPTMDDEAMRWGRQSVMTPNHYVCVTFVANDQLDTITDFTNMCLS